MSGKPRKPDFLTPGRHEAAAPLSEERIRLHLSEAKKGPA
jgi:hypothetical protein